MSTTTDTSGTKVLMESGGMYSEHTKSTSKIADRVLPILSKAAASSGSLEDDSLFTYCDFGVADGGVAGAVSKALVAHVKSINKTKPIQIVFEDQAENDFSPVLTKHQDSTCNGFDNVFISVVGRSFFKQCLPTESVNLSFCSLSTHWPDFSTDAEFDIPPRSVSALVGVEWKKESKCRDDWERFLVHRAHELKKNGHLMVVSLLMPSDYKDGVSASAEAFRKILETSCLHEIYEDLQKEGRLNPNENFFVPGHSRTKEDFEAPFLKDSSPVRKAGLRLCSQEEVFVPCSFTEDFREGKLSVEEFGQALALHERAWSEFIVAQSLAVERKDEEKQQLVEEIYARLAKRLTSKVPNVGLPYILSFLVAKKE